jgi:hypothetical protein
MNESYGGKPGFEKGTLQASYYNTAGLSKEIEEIGYRGIQVLDIWALTAYGTAGDRRRFEVEGNGIIIPPAFDIQTAATLHDYNVGLRFGVSFNGEGTDQSDDWIDFNTTATPNFPYMSEIRNVLFHRLWFRNNTDTPLADDMSIRVYIIQDVSFIEQVNKLLKNIIK